MIIFVLVFMYVVAAEACPFCTSPVPRLVHCPLIHSPCGCFSVVKDTFLTRNGPDVVAYLFRTSIYPNDCINLGRERER